MITVIVGLLGGGAALWCVVLWRSALVDTVRSKAEADALRKELADVKGKLDACQAGATDSTRRLEAVVAQYKAELVKAEADLAASRNPDTIRTRLRRVLNGG